MSGPEEEEGLEVAGLERALSSFSVGDESCGSISQSSSPPKSPSMAGNKESVKECTGRGVWQFYPSIKVDLVPQSSIQQ